MPPGKVIFATWQLYIPAAFHFRDVVHLSGSKPVVAVSYESTDLWGDFPFSPAPVKQHLGKKEKFG